MGAVFSYGKALTYSSNVALFSIYFQPICAYWEILSINLHKSNYRKRTRIPLKEYEFFQWCASHPLNAAETLYDLNADETIRAQCRAREDYNSQQRAIKYHIKEITSELKKVTYEKQQLASENQKLIADAEFYKKLLDEHGISYDAANKNKWSPHQKISFPHKTTNNVNQYKPDISGLYIFCQGMAQFSLRALSF
jgi:hypothetical protein